MRSFKILPLTTCGESDGERGVDQYENSLLSEFAGFLNVL
jgi:hypothetical protein